MRTYRVRFKRLPDITFIVRPISRRDVVELLEGIQSSSNYQRICYEDILIRRCVLEPANLDVDSLPAGIVQQLAKAILHVSGLLELESIQDKVKRWMETVDGKLEILAVGFLGYKLSELWDLSMEEWQYVIAAAVQSAALHGVDVSSYVNREQQDEVKRQATVNQMMASSRVARPVSYGAQQPSIEKEMEFVWHKED